MYGCYGVRFVSPRREIVMIHNLTTYMQEEGVLRHKDSK